MRIEWQPGQLRALVWPSAVALLGTRADAATVVGLWEGKAQQSLPQFLEALSEALSVGLLSLPDFAVAYVADGIAHVACRGPFTIVLADDGAGSELSGADVSTWAERRVPVDGLSGIVLTSSEGSSAVEAVETLPLHGAGVLPASRVLLDLVEEGPRPGAVAAGGASSRGPEQSVPVRTAVPVAQETLIEVGSSTDCPDVDPAVEPEAEPDGEAAPPVEAEPAAAEQAHVDELDDQRDAPRGRFSALLADHTHMYAVEQAAVRPVDDHTSSDVASADGVDDSVETDDADREVDGDRVEAPTAVVATPSPSQPAPTPPVDEPRVAPDGTGFISAVPSPGRSASASAAVPAEGPNPVASAPEVQEEGFDHHDGFTVLGDLDDPEEDARATGSVALGDGGGPVVRGRLCARSHGNPPQRTECRVCGEPLEGGLLSMARPPVGWLHTSTGESIALTETVLAGRAPQPSRFQGTSVPRLLPLPHGHVSGTHLEVRIEGWSVLAADLRSTNGTFLQRPGQPTVRLSDQPHLLVSHDVLNLGHGVTLRFEELP